MNPKPPKLSVYTWVREDVFAGFLADDAKQFQAGVEKLDRILAENPNDPDALVFRGGAEVYRAVRAHEAGRAEEFRRLYDRGVGTMERAYALAPKNIGVLATSGGVGVVFADRLSPKERTAMWERTRTRYRELAAAQQQYLDKLPVRMRGEVLGGLAQSEHKLGDSGAARTYLTRIVATLGDTPYGTRAKRWLDDPAAAEKNALVCLTCHEPGRLKNQLAEPSRQ